RIVHALVACLVATIDRARAGIRAVARRASAGAVAACVADRTEQAVAACRPIHRRRVVHALVVGLIAAVCGAIVPIRAAALSADTAAGDADVANGTEQAVVAAGAVQRRGIVHALIAGLIAAVGGAIVAVAAVARRSRRAGAVLAGIVHGAEL